MNIQETNANSTKRRKCPWSSGQWCLVMTIPMQRRHRCRTIWSVPNRRHGWNIIKLNVSSLWRMNTEARSSRQYRVFCLERTCRGRRQPFIVYDEPYHWSHGDEGMSTNISSSSESSAPKSSFWLWHHSFWIQGVIVAASQCCCSLKNDSNWKRTVVVAQRRLPCTRAMRLLGVRRWTALDDADVSSQSISRYTIDGRCSREVECSRLAFSTTPTPTTMPWPPCSMPSVASHGPIVKKWLTHRWVSPRVQLATGASEVMGKQVRNE